MFPRSLLLLAAAAHLASAWQTECGDGSFEPREATIDSVHRALFSGLTTCREVVSSFIARVENFNPYVNAVIALNPQAFAIADQMDRKIASGNFSGSLFCIPVFLKDNFDTADMKTTGGSLALADCQPSRDAPSVTALKEAGAIILGKANLHELALEGLSVSSLGGQTLNPYDFTRTPGGSSGGSAVAIASSFCVFATGTDTVNSLRSPAASNSLFSIRPTRGLITRAGIIPVSFTQDTIGPIARTVSDLAKALTVMASIGYDPADNVTALIPATSIGVDYTSYLTNANVKGKRLGLLNGLINRTASSETTPVYTAIDAMVSALTAAGAIVVPIDDPVYNSASIAVMDVQAYELRAAMDAYLSNPVTGGTHPYSLSQLYHNSSGKFLVIPNHYAFLNRSLVSSPADPGYAISKLGIQNLTISIAKTFTIHKLDAMIYPEQQNLVVKVGSPVQSGRNGIMAGLSGSPVVVVPAGFSPPTADAPIGVPIGMEIFGLPWTEGKLLSIAAGIEEIRHLRRVPVFAAMSAPCNNGSVMSVPTITPDRWNISPNYPSRG